MGLIGDVLLAVFRPLLAAFDTDRWRVQAALLLAGKAQIPALQAAVLPRVIIAGEGGSGKSTLLKQMLAQAADDGKVPVWVSLASLPIDGPLTIASLVDHLVHQAQSLLGLGEVNPAFFEALVRDGRMAIGFDALDECGSLVRRQKVRGLIVEIAREWNGCQVFVTSRPEALRETPLPLVPRNKPLTEELKPEQFLAFEPMPFTRGDVAPFLRAAFADGDTLAQTLLARTGLEALLESPLTLTLVGLVARSSAAGLPATRTPLFAQCLKTACETWEDAKRPGSTADGLDAPQRRDVLRRLGWEAQRVQGNVLGALAARRALTMVPAFSAPGRAESIVNGLAARNLLLRAETAGAAGLEVQRIRFAHPQFREYLAGAHFAEQFAHDAAAAASTMAPYWFDSGWLDVLRFAAATVENDAELLDELLRTALAAEDPFRDLLHRPEFLVAHLLARLPGAEPAVVTTVAACLEQAAITEPALRDEAARSVLALTQHPPATPAIRRFALGQGIAPAFAEEDEAFRWRLRAIEAFASAGSAAEALKLLLGLPTEGVGPLLDVCELRVRLGDRGGAVAAWKRCFDDEDNDWRERIAASMDTAGEGSEFDAWLRACLVSGRAKVADAKLAGARALEGGLDAVWARLFEAAAAELGTLGADAMFAPSQVADAVYAALDPEIVAAKHLPARRTLVAAAMRHPAFTWFAGDKVRADYPDLVPETIEQLTRYVLDGSVFDHSRVRSAVLAVCDEPDDALAVPALLRLLRGFDPNERWGQAVAVSLARRGHAAAGLQELKPVLAVPTGVSDRHPDSLERRRDVAWRLARRLDAAQALALADAMYRSGDAQADAHRLAQVWGVSGVAAIADDWLRELAREGADGASRQFAQMLLMTHPALLDDGATESAVDKEYPPPWTRADYEGAFEFALQHGHFVDGHDNEEEATISNLLGLLSAITTEGGHDPAQRHADAWVGRTVKDESLLPTEQAELLTLQLDGLSRLGLANERWLEDAAALARRLSPADRAPVIRWLSANA